MFLLSAEVLGQRVPGRITALIVVEDPDFHDHFEVSLVNDVNHVVDSVTAESQERLTFPDLEKDVYFVVAEVPGFKPVRRRVEFGGEGREANLCIILEPQPVVMTKGNTSDESLVTSVSRLAQPPALLKELAAAEKKLHAGSVDEARTRLESIVGQAPDFYDAHRVLAMTYQKDHRYRDAEKEYRVAQRLDPVSPSPGIGIASIALEEIEIDAGTSQSQRDERLKDARDSLQQALKLDPTVAFAHYLMGITDYKLSHYEEAERNLTHALELDSALGVAHLALANLYLRTKALQAALAQLDLYLKKNPRAADRAEVLAKRSEIEQATAVQSAENPALAAGK